MKKISGLPAGRQGQRLRRKLKIKAKISRNLTKPRVSVFRSSRHISAQIIDDQHGKTLVAIGDNKIKTKGLTKTQIARKVGENLGKLALSKKISYVRFDRGFYTYHGRVKALAEGARNAGLKF